MGLKIIFTNSKMPLSPIIRAVTWSDFSHMAIIINETEIIHSDFHGVRIEPLAALQGRSKNWMIVEYPCARPEDVIEACKTQLGKPYDFSGLIGIAIRNVDLQDDSKWWCSELPAYGGHISKQPFFQEEYLHRIAPQNWLMLPHAVLQRS